MVFCMQVRAMLRYLLRIINIYISLNNLMSDFSLRDRVILTYYNVKLL